MKFATGSIRFWFGVRRSLWKSGARTLAEDDGHGGVEEVPEAEADRRTVAQPEQRDGHAERDEDERDVDRVEGEAADIGGGILALIAGIGLRQHGR